MRSRDVVRDDARAVVPVVAVARGRARQVLLREVRDVVVLLAVAQGEPIGRWDRVDGVQRREERLAVGGRQVAHLSAHILDHHLAHVHGEHHVVVRLGVVVARVGAALAARLARGGSKL